MFINHISSFIKIKFSFYFNCMYMKMYIIYVIVRTFKGLQSYKNLLYIIIS
jgi:hypothetical protein